MLGQGTSFSDACSIMNQLGDIEKLLSSFEPHLQNKI
jgi:hypothetical protein